MKKLLLIAAAWLISAPAMAGGIDFFHGSFEEALAKAKAENKLVFVDVYTSWCGPCKMMVLNVFPREEVGEFFNARFVSFKLDAEDAKINGPQIARRYGIRLYPTYLFINPDGTEKYRGTGFKQADAFVNLARASLGDPRDLFSALDKRYQAGERNPAFIREYLLHARYASPLWGESPGPQTSWEGARKIFNEYMAGRDKKQLINGEDYALMESYLHGAQRDNEYVDFIANNYDAFIKVAPESQVAFFLLESVKYSVGAKAGRGDKTYLQNLAELDGLLKPAYKLQVEVIRNDYLYREYMERLGRGAYLRATQDWQGMLDDARAGIANKGDAATARDYGSVAGTFNAVKDPAILKQVLPFANKAYDMQPSAAHALSYASLLQRLERNAEALQIAEKGLAAFDAQKDRAPAKQGLESLISTLNAPKS